MPIVLSMNDCSFLRELAKSNSSSPEEANKHYENATKGYQTYANEEMIQGVEVSTRDSNDLERQTFFKKHFDRLITNLGYAGKDSATVFTNSRGHIWNTFRRLGIPERDRDEITDAAIVKMWRFQHAEKYNPLASAWRHHVYLALQRMASSYWERRTRDPIAKGFAFQQYEGPSDAHGDEFNLEPYEITQDLTNVDRLVVEEALTDFENFLSKQPPYRAGEVGNHRYMCTLLPPGIEGCILSENTQAFIIRRSRDNYRIEFPDGNRYLWPTRLILKDSDKKNPDWDPNKTAAEIVRDPRCLFRLVMEYGAQIREIEKALKVGPATAYNWIRIMEGYFEEWWKTSPHIHTTVRWMARPVCICFGCGEAHLTLPEKSTKPAIKITTDMGKIIHTIPRQDSTDVQEVHAHWCDECNKFTIDAIGFKINLPYPWGKVRGSHDLKERSAKYEPGLTIQKCRF